LIESAMRGLQRVTVRTQDSKVLDPVVALVAVDVIELDGNATIGCSRCPVAQLACSGLEPGADQPVLQVVARGPRIRDEHLFEWTRWTGLEPHAHVPALAPEVRGVEAKGSNPLSQHIVVPSRSDQSQRAQHGRVPVRRCHGATKVIVAPSRRSSPGMWPSKEVLCRDAEDADASLHALRIRVRSLEAEDLDDHDEARAARHDGPQLVIGEWTRREREVTRVQIETFDVILDPVVIPATQREAELA